MWFLKDGKSKVEGAKLLKMVMQCLFAFKLHIQPLKMEICIK
jgi:hypothetical protein